MPTPSFCKTVSKISWVSGAFNTSTWRKQYTYAITPTESTINGHTYSINDMQMGPERLVTNEKHAAKTRLSCYIPCWEKNLVFYHILQTTVSIDSGRAFDTVSFGLLIKEMTNMWIHLKIAGWMEEFLNASPSKYVATVVCPRALCCDLFCSWYSSMTWPIIWPAIVWSSQAM